MKVKNPNYWERPGPKVRNLPSEVSPARLERPFRAHPYHRMRGRTLAALLSLPATGGGRAKDREDHRRDRLLGKGRRAGRSRAARMGSAISGYLEL